MTYCIPAYWGKVLVLGDVMLDRYWSGGIHRISPEAPVPVVSIENEVECPGGAANVALNVAALGASVKLLGVCGDDLPAQVLEKKLALHHVESYLIKDPGQKTIVKLRILGPNQQLLRLDFDSITVINAFDLLKKKFMTLIKEVDILILSDYAKGTLLYASELIAIANEHGVRVLVDPKTSDLSLYKGAFLITPNLKEFQSIVGFCPGEKEILERGQQLLENTDFSALLVTRSENGMTLFQRNKLPFTLSAHQQEVYDVTGAGDTVIAVLGACLSAGLSLEDAIKLANLAAGISVRKLNAATVTVAELRREIWRQTKPSNEKHIMTQEELLITVADAKAHGESIVMTNGCFDLLHPGHIAYLEQAKQLGDRLIVAINDDLSVSRLKGAQRPINDLNTRMQMIAALRVVDWVTSFHEDTPENLINQILPDILVKGGDYQVHEIAGHDAVVANGGKVIILSFLPGYSSTKIIEKIKESSS